MLFPPKPLNRSRWNLPLISFQQGLSFSFSQVFSLGSLSGLRGEVEKEKKKKKQSKNVEPAVTTYGRPN